MVHFHLMYNKQTESEKLHLSYKKQENIKKNSRKF